MEREWSERDNCARCQPDAEDHKHGIWSYDHCRIQLCSEANNRTSEDQTIGSITRRIQSDPDADGNRKNLLIKSGANFNTTNFAQLFRLHQPERVLNIRNGSNAVWFTYSYDAAGNVVKRLNQLLGDYTQVPSNSYDGLNRPTYWDEYYSNGTRFDRIQYVYTKLGNLKNILRQRLCAGHEQGRLVCI